MRTCPECDAVGYLDGYGRCGYCGMGHLPGNWTDDPGDLTRAWTGYRRDGKKAAELQ